MRSVFIKEWRQGHMTVLFGLLLGGVITAIWGILTTAWVRDWQDQEAVNAFCGILFCIVSPVLAVYVGSGLVAAEVERGTIAPLLALPISRRQVWLGKLLAGLALSFSAIVLVFAPGAIAVRPAFQEIEFWIIAPELVLGSVLFFVIAFFWSTLCGTILSAVLATIALFFALYAAAIVVLILGGRVLGGWLTDLEFWLLIWVPALIVGSYVGFVRGELFRSRRRWAAPLLVAAAVAIIASVPVMAFARWYTRYDRSKVEQLADVGLTGGSSVIGCRTHGSRVVPLREAERRWPGKEGQEYRNNYSVCLDADTGRELLVRRGADTASVSPDGKLAAILTAPSALTWRGSHTDYPTSVIEIWDLAKRRMRYRGLPHRLAPQVNQSISWTEWSPDARWLALVTLSYWDPSLQQLTHSIIVVDPNSSPWRTVYVWEPWNGGTTWAWAPDRGAIYMVEREGSIVHHDLLSGREDTIWRFPGEQLVPDYELRSADIAVSPRGRRLLIVFVVEHKDYARAHIGIAGRTDQERPDLVLLAFAVASDGSQSRLVYRGVIERQITERHAAWSQDGTTFYSAHLLSGPRHTPVQSRVLLWREGEEEASVVPIASPEWVDQIAVLPDGDLLMWGRNDAWLLDRDGAARPFPNEHLRKLARKRDSHLLGLDNQGRAVFHRPDQGLFAVHLGTGRLTEIYP